MTTRTERFAAWVRKLRVFAHGTRRRWRLVRRMRLREAEDLGYYELGGEA